MLQSYVSVLKDVEQARFHVEKKFIHDISRALIVLRAIIVLFCLFKYSKWIGKSLFPYLKPPVLLNYTYMKLNFLGLVHGTGHFKFYFTCALGLMG